VSIGANNGRVTGIAASLAAALPLVLALAGPAGAATVQTVNVNCSTGGSVQSAINAATADKLVLNLTGNCTENITVPAALEVAINTAQGGAGALVHADITGPALRVQGRAVISGVPISSTLQTNGHPLVRVDPAGHVEFYDSSATAPGLFKVFSAYGPSFLQIGNATVTGGTESTIDLGGGATGVIFATTGGTSTTTTITSPAAGLQAIGCWQSSLFVSSSGAGAVVTIGGGKMGISGRDCRGEVSANWGQINVTQTKTLAVSLDGGVQSFVGVAIAGGSADGLAVSGGNLRVTGGRIAGRVTAVRQGVIEFAPAGTRTVVRPAQLSCQYGGTIYVRAGSVAGTAGDLGCSNTAAKPGAATLVR
jgi:hypothetical protein